VPVEYKIDHEKRCIHARAHGQVVLQEILDYFDAVVLADASAYGKLFDAREMEPRLSDDDFMVLAACVSAYAAYDPRGAVAAVATTKEAIGALRRYMNFLGADDRPIRLFASIEEARDWLEGAA
jgi:hypothetical protein